MSKRAITAGIIVSSVCLFLYSVLVIAQYVLYNGLFKGIYTIGDFVASSNTINFLSSWLVKIAAFLPMMLFFRCTLRWKKGAKWVILIVAVVAPAILSNIGSFGYNLGFNSVANKTMSGIIGLTVYIWFSFFANAISSFIWAAAVYGLGLAGKTAIQPAPPAEENHFDSLQNAPL